MQHDSRENDQESLSPRCHVGFSILGSSLDFDGISTTLNQPSAEARRAGSQTALGPLIDDVWNIGSPFGPEKPLKEHLRWLGTQLEPHSNYLRDLSRTADIRIYIGFTLSQEQNGFAIPSQFVRLFASFNAFIEMYILCNCGEDSKEARASTIGLAGIPLN